MTYVVHGHAILQISHDLGDTVGQVVPGVNYTVAIRTFGHAQGLPHRGHGRTTRRHVERWQVSKDAGRLC